MTVKVNHAELLQEKTIKIEISKNHCMTTSKHPLCCKNDKKTMNYNENNEK